MTATAGRNHQTAPPKQTALPKHQRHHGRGQHAVGRQSEFSDADSRCASLESGRWLLDRLTAQVARRQRERFRFAGPRPSSLPPDSGSGSYP